MQKTKASKKCGLPASAATKLLALLVFVCLAECATEERINSKGSKLTNLVEKVNGWRSQRGGSCLSYGHSCWGAHGKRSGKLAAPSPDWYLTRILRRIAANDNLNGGRRQITPKNMESSDIYPAEISDDSSANNRLENEDSLSELGVSRNPEAIPMIDDSVLPKMKIWQLMRQASEDQ